jgi:acetate kinase
MTDALLTINAGSSSIKFALFTARTLAMRVSGQVERIGTAPRFSAHDAQGSEMGKRSFPHGASRTYEEIFDDLLTWVEHHLAGARLVGVGHRVVHGGRDFAAPVRVSPDVVAKLEQLVPLAPLHQTHSLHAIGALTRLRPNLSQVACFDTAFHRGHTDAVRHFAIPRALSDSGIERYGFHGLSYEYIAGRLAERSPAPRCAVVAHLGNGASLCGLRDGRSVDSTMGFTAVDGLPMGTRCGNIDPGVILYLQQTRGMSADDVEDLIYHKSGLLGVSGLSSDMRTLLASADPHAAEAVEMFCYRIARGTAALATAVGGIDALVFTAGIGERAAPVRARVGALLGWIGVRLDQAANAKNETIISAPGSSVQVLVIPTDEEVMIARHTKDILQHAA